MSKSKQSKYRFTDSYDQPSKDFSWLNAKKIRREKQNRLRQVVEDKKD